MKYDSDNRLKQAFFLDSMTEHCERKHRMNRGFRFFVGIIFLLTLISCSESTNPLPIVDSIAPTAYVQGMPSFTIVVTGEDFVQGSQIIFNGTALDTKYSGSKTLSAEVSTELIETAATGYDGALSSSDEISIPVYVKNPPSGGGDSEIQQFVIRKKFTYADPVKISELKLEVNTLKIYYDKYNTIHTLWQSEDSENSYLWLNYSTSKSNGDNFSSPSYLKSSTLSETTGKKIDIVSSENKNTFLFWNYRVSTTDSTDDHIWCNFSEDNGSSFSTSFYPAEVTDEIEDFTSGAFGTGNVFSAWINRNADDVGLVLFTRTIDRGTTFSAAQQLNVTPAYSGIGMVVDENGIITVSWIASDIYTGRDAIIYAASTNFGESFNTQRVLSVAAAQKNFKRLFTIIADDGKIYRAWWQTNGVSGQNPEAQISVGNEDSSYFNLSTIASFSNVDADALPEIQLAVDKANNVYAAIVTNDNIMHIYRSSDGCASFQEIIEPKNWGAVGPASFTLAGNGGIIIIYPGKVQYESTVDGETVTITATEVFFVKSNE